MSLFYGVARSLRLSCIALVLMCFVKTSATDLATYLNVQDTPFLGGETWLPLGEGIRGDCAKMKADDQGNLYAIGRIYNAGGKAAKNVVKWDGANWHPLGMGIQGECIGMDVNKEGHLVVVGKFTQAGEVETNNIALWDGSKWQALGDGLEGVSQAVTFDSKGNIWTTQGVKTDGQFVSTLMKWDGQAWIKVADGIKGSCIAIATDQFGAVYIGGKFSAIGNFKANNIAKWDGQAWSTFGEGLNDSCFELKVGKDGRVYVGGMFKKSGNKYIESVAQWTGLEWLRMGVRGTCFALYLDEKDNLYVGGYDLQFFQQWGTGVELHRANNIAKWNGVEWSTLGHGLAHCRAITVNSKGVLFAAGRFREENGQTINGIGQWAGQTQWASIGGGIEGKVCYTMAQDSKGNVYFGGEFYKAGDQAVNNIVMWDGEQWHALGGGLNGYCSVIEIDENDQVYVGGRFTKAGKQAARNIAKWDGNKWHAIGKGCNSDVFKIIIRSEQEIYVFSDFGSYTKGDQYIIYFIGKWNGKSWQPIKELVNIPPAGMLTDAKGNLYIGMLESKVNGKKYGYGPIIKWDGKKLSTVGKNSIGNGGCLNIALDQNGDLYAYGNFDLEGRSKKIHRNIVIKLKGDTWVEHIDLKEEWHGYLKSRVMYFDENNALYVSGIIDNEKITAANGIFRYKDGAFEGFGSGTKGDIHAILINQKTNCLYVAGSLEKAGGKKVQNIAQWKF